MRLTRVHVDAPLATGRRHTIEGDAANHITASCASSLARLSPFSTDAAASIAARIESVANTR